MSPELEARARAVFMEIVEVDETDRVGMLDERCGSDAELRAEVETLLGHDAVGRRRMDTPLVVPPVEPTSAALPRTIGSYQIRGVIASGGMGTVYEAEQEHPKRLVAVKVMRRGASSPHALRRFHHEAEMLGRLRHPNIAQVYDAGTYDEGDGPQPFFVMELVRGRPLVRYCRDHGLSNRQRLDLFARICNAVQHAHQQGVIHRDLKPDNILVDDLGEPKVLDFGVARATDVDTQTATLRTDIGQLIGTIPYMSPEQVTGDPADLDTRTDIYSLGVVLYELLAERLPHDLTDRTIPEAARIIREEEPAPLSSVDRVFRGDLETIVAKTLEKEKDRRYQTAAELAADVRRYLADEPIVARPASTFYQLRKFTRRNKTLVGGVIGMLILLVAGTTVSTIGFVRARDEASKSALVSGFLTEIFTSDGSEERDNLTMGQVLAKAAPRIDVEFGSYPEVAAQLHYAVGGMYQRLSKWKKAEKNFLDAVDEARRVGREELALSAEEGLVYIGFNRNQFAKTVPLAQAVYEKRVRLLGTNDAATMRSLKDLGSLLGNIDDPVLRAEGEQHIREARVLARNKYGERFFYHWMTQALENLLLRQMRFSEAASLAESVAEWAGSQTPPRTGMRAVALTDLAYDLGWMGRADEAAALADEALRLKEGRLSPGQKISSTTLRTAGMTLQWVEKPAEAKKRFLRLQRLHPSPFADFLVARLGMLDGTLEPAEAEQTLRQLPSEDLPSVGRRFADLRRVAYALCLTMQDRHDEAEAVLAKLDGDLFAAIPEHHWERRLHRRTLEEIAEGRGR